MADVIEMPENPIGYPITIDEDGFVKIPKITWEYALESLEDQRYLIEELIRWKEKMQC